MQKLISFIVFLLFCVSVQAQKAKPLFPQMPGMVSYTYRNSLQKNMAATIDTLQRLGIKDMEFSNLFGKSAQEIRQLLDKRGIQCSSFGVSYEDAVNKTSEVAANALALGARYVRVAWIPHQPPFNISHAQKAVADFNRIGKILKEQYGLTFCYHNHGYEFVPHEKGTLFDYIITQTDPKYVSFEMDILWTFFPGGNPAALLKKYGKRFQLMHLKDLKKGITGNLSGQTPVENDVALGTGQINIADVLKAARKYIQHYYIEDESPSYAEQVPRSIKFLQALTE